MAMTRAQALPGHRLAGAQGLRACPRAAAGAAPALAPAAAARRRPQQPQLRCAASKAPLYDRLGGSEAVSAAVDLFYDKVLADDRVKDYFAGTNMAKQKGHQRAFMSMAFGGPASYKGKGMADAHRGLVPHLTEVHFNAIVECLVATLTELGVAQEDIDEAVAVVATTKDQVLAD